MVIARGMRPTLNVSSTSFWNPSFSSRMATGNKPPYAVRLLPSKSYGVEAPILLGSGITRSAPCGTRLSSLCSLLRLTIWVTPRSRLAKLELRGLSVLQQDFRGPQVVLSFSPSYSTQRPCIGQVSMISIQSNENVRSAIVNCLCPECGGAIELYSKQLRCLGRCGKQWRAIWESAKRVALQTR